jgi:4,5-dihydroxyphthalate decarboxylase
VGVRSYTVSWGVWVRGVLATEYGVNLDRVTWVVMNDDRLEAYKPPPNVEMRRGADLGAMLLAGELDAAIEAPVDSPEVRPLIAHAREAEARWHQKTGIYPINHVLVVSDALLHSQPWVVRDLFAAFKAAKEAYLMELASAGPSSPGDQETLRLQGIVGPDPWPYGIEKNQGSLNAILDFVYQQHITPRRLSIQEVFAPESLALL